MFFVLYARATSTRHLSMQGIISLNFLKALLVLGCLILLIKRKLNIRTPYRTSLSIITAKTPFLSSPLVSLYYKSVNGVSYTRTNIFIGRDWVNLYYSILSYRVLLGAFLTALYSRYSG